MAFMITLLLVVAIAVVGSVAVAAFDRDPVMLGGVSIERMRRKYSKGGVLGFLNNKKDDCGDVEELYFDGAVIDNFAPVNSQETWRSKGQRYFVNRKFWAGAGAPIFVFIGGEGEESCQRLSENLYMYELAKENNALMIDVEHRFYGQSLPTEDSSTKNLAYLSSDQALADLARIIPHIKQQLNSPHSKVITFGGSYPGNLSGWFRLKYPSITQGSIASSAPVRAEENFSQYMDVVGEALLYFGGQACFNAFEEASNAIAQLASGGPGSDGMAKLEKDFQLCKAIQNENDLAVFYMNMMGIVQGVVQYNTEIPGQPTVADLCTTMAGGGTGYDQFVALNKQMMELGKEKCQTVSYDSFVKMLTHDTGVPTNAMRSWIYQSCAEFGYFQTTDSPNQPFHAFKEISGLKFSRQWCYDGYDGWTADPAIAYTNTKYGATDIDVTNVVFTSGTIDPWHALGVTNYTKTLPQESSIPAYILGTAHCADLKAPKEDDPESLKQARVVVADNVRKWLQ